MRRRVDHDLRAPARCDCALARSDIPGVGNELEGQPLNRNHRRWFFGVNHLLTVGSTSEHFMEMGCFPLL